MSHTLLRLIVFILLIETQTEAKVP